MRSSGQKIMIHCCAYALAVAIQEIVRTANHDKASKESSAARKMFADAVVRFFP